VLLLGPAVAIDERNTERTALMTLLAKSLAQQLNQDVSVTGPGDFRYVAQMFLSREATDRVDLEMAVKDFYSSYTQQTTELHRLLAQLCFSLCINTTYDSFLANAFKAVGKNPQLAYYSFRKPRAMPSISPSPKTPMVFNLYGDLTDPNSLVLTENDLLDFLACVIKNAPPLPSAVTARFSAPDTSFLFLGFGFQRWYVRILLHVLQAARHRYGSLALEDTGFFDHSDQRQTALFFEREHLIRFKLFSWEDFVRELTRQVTQIKTEARDAPPEAASSESGGPLVFLCYVHEDREAVDALADRLQSMGIRIWLDKQKLRGGDDWDRLIKDVVGKHVDYVAVLQSPRMHGQIKSYVFKEIDLALQTQKLYARNVRFILPVKLEECDSLEQLAHLQWVDLVNPEGTEQLARTIREDWNLRQTSSFAKRNAS
jgi:hypothetical protein